MGLLIIITNNNQESDTKVEEDEDGQRSGVEWMNTVAGHLERERSPTMSDEE